MKFKVRVLLVAIILLGTLIINGCYRCSCTCKEYDGCVIVHHKQLVSGKIFKSDTFCIKGGYSFTALIDTFDKYSYYENDNTIVIDSLKTIQSISKIDCDEVDSYRQKGLDCNCFK